MYVNDVPLPNMYVIQFHKKFKLDLQVIKIIFFT